MKRSDFMLGGRDFNNIVASQIMETNICRVTEDTTWYKVSQIMTEHDVTSLPVVNSKLGLVGIVTEYDMIGPIAEGKDVTKLTAKDIMTKELQIVTESTPSINILKIFNELRVFKVFVIEKDILKGVIAKHDVILAYLNATIDAPKGF